MMFEVNDEGSGLTVLRTFRLFRILKLVRFFPGLQRQLVVMLRTMDNVVVFFGLLSLFIFIFRSEIMLMLSESKYELSNLTLFCSILGMQLFGCMFCDPNTGLCDRKNFDSLLWATVTVFQVEAFRCQSFLFYTFSHFVNRF